MPSPVIISIALFTCILVCLRQSQAQLVSPCPRIFSYEPQKEKDKWFGVVTLTSESDLNGVWLRLLFDKPSIQLGNWFGEIKTEDNQNYLIRNPQHRVKASMPYALRFYIKYDVAEAPPKLIEIRLNAKTVCPEGETTTQAAITGSQLQTSGPSNPKPTTVAPPVIAVAEPVPIPVPRPETNNQDAFVRPGGGWPPSTGVDDDDSFIGDFQLIGRPHLNQRPAIEPECGTVVTSTRRVKRQTGYYRSDWQPVVEIKPGQNLYRLLMSLMDGVGQSWQRDYQQPQQKGYQPYWRDDGDEIAPIEAQPKPLITYGQSTSEGEFPWHAALYHERGADLQYICGASLISKQHVLTVAHCVTRRRTQTTLNPDSLVIYFGKYYLKKWSNPGIQDSQVSTILPHSQYNSQTYANDIALIKLVNPISITDFVRPICLWEDQEDLKEVLNKPGTVVGWGFDHTGKVTEELTQAKMPVVTKETCIYSFPDFFSRFTTSKTYCAGFRNGTSVCNGDSGGGMVFPKATSTPNRQAWQLRGLVSISVALQNQFRCDSSHYVVFTDVAKYLDWIKTTMQK